MNEQIGNKINDKTYIPLPPFKGWVLENFPFIEDDFDCITNYQMLCLMFKKLNDVISNQNTVQELGSQLVLYYNALVDAVNLAINEFETEVTADINQFKIDTNTEISNFETFITGKFNELKDYVDNFFDNNFPEMVSNKLDEMAEDGTLENLLNDTAHLIKVYNTYTEMISDSSSFTNGLRLKTLGYNTINDGGGAEYYVTDTQHTNAIQYSIGTLYIELIKNKNLYSKQLGIFPTNNDNTTLLQTLINNSNNYEKVILQGGEYEVNNSLTITPSTKIFIDGNVIINDNSENSVFINCVDGNDPGYHNEIFNSDNGTIEIINKKTSITKTCFEIGDSSYTFNGIINKIKISSYSIGIKLNPVNLYWVKLDNMTFFNNDIGIQLTNVTKVNSDEMMIIENSCFTRNKCCMEINNTYNFRIINTAFDFNTCVFYCTSDTELRCLNCHFEGVGNRTGELSEPAYNSFKGIMHASNNNYDYKRSRIIIDNSYVLGSTIAGFNYKMFTGSTLYVIISNSILWFFQAYKDLLKGDNAFEDVFLTDSNVRDVKIINCMPYQNDIYPIFYDRTRNLVDEYLESDSTTEEKTIASADVGSLLESLTYYDLYGTGSQTDSGTKYQITTLNGNKKQIVITPPHLGAISCLALITKKYFDISLLDSLMTFAFSKSVLTNCIVRYDIIFYDNQKNQISVMETSNNAGNLNATDWFTNTYPNTRPYTNLYTPLIPPKNAETFKIRYYLRATNNANSISPAYFTGFNAYI